MGELVKDFGSEIIPGTPGTPSIPGTAPVYPVTFRLIATPSPPGYKYRYRGPVTFKTLQQIVDDGGVIPPGATPVFSGGVDSELIGYDIPGEILISNATQFETWSQIETVGGTDLYGPIPNMTFVEFRDVFERLANGYPAPMVSGTITGYFYLPTVSGGNTLFTQQFRKTGPNGWWMPTSSLAIPYTAVRGAAAVRMMSNFPGSPGSEGTPGIPGTPDRIVPVALQGWSTGANSIEMYGNDLRLTFNAYVKSGAVIGFTNDMGATIDREAITHGFYFDTDVITPRVRIYERGAIKAPFTDTYDPATSAFKIERISGVVTYYVDDVAVQTSRSLSGGATIVRTALYRSDDSIGGDYE